MDLDRFTTTKLHPWNGLSTTVPGPSLGHAKSASFRTARIPALPLRYYRSPDGRNSLYTSQPLESEPPTHLGKSAIQLYQLYSAVRGAMQWIQKSGHQSCFQCSAPPLAFQQPSSIFRLHLLVNWLAGLTKNLQSTSAWFNLNRLTASSISGFWFIWVFFSVLCYHRLSLYWVELHLHSERIFIFDIVMLVSYCCVTFASESSDHVCETVCLMLIVSRYFFSCIALV
jgi:hypothetical protein